jgi:hypothetical protein
MYTYAKIPPPFLKAANDCRVANEIFPLCWLICAGIVKAIGKALGKEPRIVLYDPEKTGTGKGGKAEGFPFR